MTQITDHTTFRNVKVELSQDGSTWIDFSGEANSVETSGGGRKPMELQPILGDIVLVPGRADAVNLEIRVVWRGASGSAAALAERAYSHGIPIFARYAPEGDASGKTRYRTAEAYVTQPVIPGGRVDEGQPLLVSLKLRTSKIIKELL